MNDKGIELDMEPTDGRRHAQRARQMKRLLADIITENRAALHAPTLQPTAPERILVEVAIVILAIGLGCMIVWWFA